jgi:hypothetical protein
MNKNKHRSNNKTDGEKIAGGANAVRLFPDFPVSEEI